MSKKAADYCEAVEGNFAWFSQLCMKMATGIAIEEGDEYGVCDDHNPTHTPAKEAIHTDEERAL